ncbi:SH3 domain-containing protein [Neobacillus citreus]|uniref:LysM peptidoglycan-binding domain-containing protein n=1 Tax=Neobacillus citreus TaxID=2833578 RepID=A0A942T206_9BACI|nr:SH3 domain-containing protein [Neobacillus citreus]MCH6264929.1 SH3 domain-containing protein [Neobacillus citreus]
MMILTREMVVNGEMTLSRKVTYGNGKKMQSLPVFASRMEKREYYKSIQFDIRNVLDVKCFLRDIRANWNTYVSQVNEWIQSNVVKKLVVTGIFTVVFGLFTSAANAAFIQEYTYQVKSGENIETIAAKHGVTAQEILDANGITSINGKKILLPKVEDRTVTATTLNVRSRPNTDSSILGTYKKGEDVKVAFIENGWAAILINGRVCYVSAAYLSQKQVIASQAKTMYVTATSLRVRESGSMSGAVLGSLKFNEGVSVISTSYGWAQIQYNGKSAYVSAAYLTNNAPTLANNEPSKPNSSTTSTSVYVIKSGDTFTKISKALGVSVAAIQALNPTVDPVKLKIGQTINIPSEATASAPSQISVTAQIGGVNPNGVFRFNTPDGRTYSAKASGNMINELFNRQGKQVTLTLEAKRGQQMTLVALR